jgi:thiamine biosynthesis protein ThiS
LKGLQSDLKHRDTEIPRFILVTNRVESRLEIPDLVNAAVVGGVDAVQIREKDLDEDALRSFTKEVIAAVEGRAVVVVNGSLRVAMELGTGLHLPARRSNSEIARARLGSDAIIGRSVHNPNEARLSHWVDYLIAGHVHETGSKPGLAAIGLEGLLSIVRSTSLPVLAIGGMSEKNLGGAIEAGAHGIATMNLLAKSEDPRGLAIKMKRALEQALARRTAQKAQSNIAAIVNGKRAEIPEGSSVTDFIESRGLHARMVVVEKNGKILKRDAFSLTAIEEGDTLEIVHAVGGG